MLIVAPPASSRRMVAALLAVGMTGTLPRGDRRPRRARRGCRGPAPADWEAMRRHRLLSPVWVVAHVLVAVVLVGFPLLGLWQLERHEQQQATDDALAQRPQQPPLTAAQLDGDPQRLAYRRVDVGGTWQPRDEVLLSTRPHQGRPGHHVLTPLRLSDGSAVLVNRGWVPYDVDAPPIAAAAPPSGEVRVTGVAVPGRDARRAGALDGQGREPGAIAAEDTVEFVSHGDPALVGRLVGENLPGVVVRADDGHRRAMVPVYRGGRGGLSPFAATPRSRAGHRGPTRRRRRRRSRHTRRAAAAGALTRAPLSTAGAGSAARVGDPKAGVGR
ncbi:MAG: hypothetical protein BRC31_05425 [Actinobacteria bacterium QS_5_72_10]|nr:MAG: hypothetical protein BRC31_05425 [Actinobacteria bacterium QS_5_72_10]